MSRASAALALLLSVHALPRPGLLAQVVAGDSVYAGPRVRGVVERAAEVHAHPPEALQSFTASVESEIAILLQGMDGEEMASQVEQFAGSVHWRREGSLVQMVEAYRGLFLGPSFSLLSSLEVPWVIPPLYGDRVSLLFSGGPNPGTGADSLQTSGTAAGSAAADSTAADSAAADSTAADSASADSAAAHTPRADPVGALRADADSVEAPRPTPKGLVHPFASDRERFYRYTGGDTVLFLRLTDRTVPLIRVGVGVRRLPDSGAVFSGEIDLDASSYQIVRMRGHLVRRPRSSSPLVGSVINRAVEEHVFLELNNGEWEGAFWLPYSQRLELHAQPAFSREGAILRLVSRFSGMEVNPPVQGRFRKAAADSLSPPGDSPPPEPLRVLELAPLDSLTGFQDWENDLGVLTAEANIRDFEDVAPPALRNRGPPRLALRTRRLSDLLRYDRVEGLFTGLGLGIRFRDAAPGLYSRVQAGYAWSESAVRGSVEVGLERERWTVGITAERELASTNDFPRPFMERPTILGLLGQDDFDYVDRRFAGLRATLRRGHGPSWGLEGGVARDRAPAVHVDGDPLWGEFRELRPVREGSFAYLRMTGSLGRAKGGGFLSPGLGGRVSWEIAHGDLDWHRLEASLRGRRQNGSWSLAGEILGGVVFAENPAPQVLFELGSYSSRLPGFPYKAFSGDRTVVAGGQIMYTLPLWTRPIRIGGMVLPGLSPSVSLETRAGWVEASSFAEPLLQELGWKDSGGIRSSAFLGIRFFGGSLGVGAGTPLGEGGAWRVEIVAGPGF